jgi:hypothetical protein
VRPDSDHLCKLGREEAAEIGTTGQLRMGSLGADMGSWNSTVTAKGIDESMLDWFGKMQGTRFGVHSAWV